MALEVAAEAEVNATPSKPKPTKRQKSSKDKEESLEKSVQQSRGRKAFKEMETSEQIALKCEQMLNNICDPVAFTTIRPETHQQMTEKLHSRLTSDLIAVYDLENVESEATATRGMALLEKLRAQSVALPKMGRLIGCICATDGPAASAQTLLDAYQEFCKALPTYTPTANILETTLNRHVGTMSDAACKSIADFADSDAKPVAAEAAEALADSLRWCQAAEAPAAEEAGEAEVKKEAQAQPRICIHLLDKNIAGVSQKRLINKVIFAVCRLDDPKDAKGEQASAEVRERAAAHLQDFLAALLKNPAGILDAEYCQQLKQLHCLVSACGAYGEDAIQEAKTAGAEVTRKSAVFSKPLHLFATGMHIKDRSALYFARVEKEKNLVADLNWLSDTVKDLPLPDPASLQACASFAEVES